MSVRPIRSARTIVAASLGAGAIVLLGAGAASAHVTVSADTATAGSYAVLTFSVPHGCEGSATTAVAIQIPESITSVTPTVNPGWTIEAEPEPLTPPVTDSHGNEVTERIATVTYTAIESLPADLRDAFELSVRLPEDAAGSTLAFPTVQTCEEGETAWVQVPADGQDAEDLADPAPSLEVIAPGTEPAAGSAEADAVATDSANTDSADAGDQLGLAALIVGSLGLIAGVLALLRRRPTA